MIRSFCVIFTLLSPVASFLVAHPVPLPANTASQRPQEEKLQALIYGWDDGDDDDAATQSPIDTTIHYETELAQCSLEGVQVAESISYDPDRLGSLARLAVAFSPAERALKLNQIERVDVMCVSQNHIDIQAIICEDGGCVSLAVPIKFPKACDVDAHLEGCVIGHLQDFDDTATQVLSTHQQQGEPTGTWDMHKKINFPSWWEYPSSPEMVSECKHMCSILNEDEFQPEVLALVQDALRNDKEGQTLVSAKVASIGPSGFCFKAQTRTNAYETSSLDIFAPFGGGPTITVESLRAAVLGTVVTAGQPVP